MGLRTSPFLDLFGSVRYHLVNFVVLDHFMNIEIEKIPELVAKADEIFFSPDGEKVLAEFLRIKDQVDEAYETIKKTLDEAGLKHDPNFKKIRGDLVSVTRKSYGSKYFVRWDDADKLPAGVATMTVDLVGDAQTVAFLPEFLQSLNQFKLQLAEKGKGDDKKQKISFSVNTKEVDKMVKLSGNLPDGIEPAEERSTTLSFKLIAHEDEESE